MTVYVDPLRNYGWYLGPNCHMIADSIDELHEMARAIGMKRAWFQPCPPHSIPHYDLVKARRDAAIARGAVELEPRPFFVVVNRLRAAGWPQHRQEEPKGDQQALDLGGD